MLHLPLEIGAHPLQHENVVVSPTHLPSHIFVARIHLGHGHHNLCQFREDLSVGDLGGTEFHVDVLNVFLHHCVERIHCSGHGGYI